MLALHYAHSMYVCVLNWIILIETVCLLNSCPFDYVKVYDGPDNSSALIGTYCGQQRNLVLYSSESSLFVHFYTLPRTANTQNRGFKGIYEFSESFVKLDFIRKYFVSIDFRQTIKRTRTLIYFGLWIWLWILGRFKTCYFIFFFERALNMYQLLNQFGAEMNN